MTEEPGRQKEEKSIREKAIRIHDSGVEWFAGQYARSDNLYATSFLYGRKRMNVLFEKEIQKLKKDARILDIGCGTGEQVQYLSDRGFEVSGIEPAQKMRDYARSKLPEEMVRDGSVLHIPFPDNSFDFVYAYEVFRYLNHNDNMQGLKEVLRVLKPGGTFFGSFVNRYALDGFLLLTGYRKLMLKWFGKPIKCHTEFETPETLKDRFRRLGFSEAEVHGAMLASLRIIFELSRVLGEFSARLLEPVDNIVSDTSLFRSLSGHLIGIGRKNGKKKI
jgi:ubiquinone/menaquinone biosynthesis C-methylase UbiE